MEYDQVCACGRVFLTWEVNEGLSEEVAFELRPDIRKSQCQVTGRREKTNPDKRPQGKSELEELVLKKQRTVNMAEAH